MIFQFYALALKGDETVTLQGYFHNKHDMEAKLQQEGYRRFFVFPPGETAPKNLTLDEYLILHDRYPRREIETFGNKLMAFEILKDLIDLLESKVEWDGVSEEQQTRLEELIRIAKEVTDE